MAHEKRNDLQYWRAISILGVLLFHIWPKQFPNGFLGVDIFFVISGYLMMLSYPTDKNVFHSIMTFYYKRIKRIMLVYLIIIIGTVLLLSRMEILSQYGIRYEIVMIMEDFKWAQKMLTNFQDLLVKRDYFQTKDNFYFFRHCWSLSVEMQFYLIFPIFMILKNFMTLIKYRLLLTSSLFLSIAFQLLTTNKILQYESLLCRIWQFSFGMLATTLPTLTNKLIITCLTMVVILVLFVLPSLPLSITSFCVVFMAAVVISANFQDILRYSIFYQISKLLIILGDISYSLYLLHWPLITYSKFYSPTDEFSLYYGFLLFCTSIMCASIFHFLIEKPLLQLSFKYCTTIFIMLNLLAAYISHESSKFEFKQPSAVTLDMWHQSLNYSLPLSLPSNWTTPKNEIEFATKMRLTEMGGGVFSCRNNSLPIEPKKFIYCEIDGKNPKAKMRALILGNSFAMNIIRVVAENPLFYEILVVWDNALIFPGHNEYEKYVVNDVIKVLKPDVVFIVQMYLSRPMFDTAATEIQNHANFKHWSEILQTIQKYSSAIILNKEHIVFPLDISVDYIRRKVYGLHVPPKLQTPARSESLEIWLNSLNCSKCQFFDYREAFCNDENLCKVIDNVTGLPLFRDEAHLSHIGLRMLKPFVDNAVAKALFSKNS